MDERTESGSLTQQQEPSWTDEKISAYAANASTTWEAKRIYDSMLKVRDDMQAQLAAAHAEVERLKAENNQMYEQVRVLPFQWGIELGEHKDRIAALESELSELRRGQYVPVKEYSYTEHLSMGPDKPDIWQRVEIRGRLVTIDRSDKGMSAALFPQGMGVCRLAPQQDVVGGVVTYDDSGKAIPPTGIVYGPIERDWSTPQEDEAWAHLQDDAQHNAAPDAAKE